MSKKIRANSSSAYRTGDGEKQGWKDLWYKKRFYLLLYSSQYLQLIVFKRNYLNVEKHTNFL